MTTVSGLVDFVLNDILCVIITSVRQMARHIHEQIVRFVIAYLLRLGARLRNFIAYHTNVKSHGANRARRYPTRNRHPPDRLMYN